MMRSARRDIRLLCANYIIRAAFCGIGHEQNYPSVNVKKAKTNGREFYAPGRLSSFFSVFLFIAENRYRRRSRSQCDDHRRQHQAHVFDSLAVSRAQQLGTAGFILRYRFGFISRIIRHDDFIGNKS